MGNDEGDAEDEEARLVKIGMCPAHVEEARGIVGRAMHEFMSKGISVREGVFVLFVSAAMASTAKGFSRVEFKEIVDAAMRTAALELGPALRRKAATLQ